MKKSLVILCTMLLSFGLVVDASAKLIDFEDVPVTTSGPGSTYYTSLDFDDDYFTLTTESGVGFDVFNTSFSDPITGKAIILSAENGISPLVKFKGSFDDSGPDVYYFDVGVGDNGADVDYAYLEAYNASGTLLASDEYIIQGQAKDEFKGDYLSVTTVDPIAYVLFWSKEGTDGRYNTAYWDNIDPKGENGVPNGNPVPEPATMFLLGAGLVGLVGASRNKFLK